MIKYYKRIKLILLYALIYYTAKFILKVWKEDMFMDVNKELHKIHS